MRIGQLNVQRPLATPTTVFNQSPPYVDVDLFASDRPLRRRGRGEWRRRRGCGAVASSAGTGARPQMFELGRLANENPPKLKTFDAKGFRRDVVEFHPAYHALHGARASRAGLHASTWNADGARAGAPAEVARAARYLHGGAGRERAHVPDHHDARLRSGACGRARAARAADAEDRLARTTIRASGRGGRRPASRSAWA